jgi:hypothetical protein
MCQEEVTLVAWAAEHTRALAEMEIVILQYRLFYLVHCNHSFTGTNSVKKKLSHNCSHRTSKPETVCHTIPDDRKKHPLNTLLPTLTCRTTRTFLDLQPVTSSWTCSATSAPRGGICLTFSVAQTRTLRTALTASSRTRRRPRSPLSSFHTSTLRMWTRRSSGTRGRSTKAWRRACHTSRRRERSRRPSARMQVCAFFQCVFPVNVLILG